MKTKPTLADLAASMKKLGVERLYLSEPSLKALKAPVTSAPLVKTSAPSTIPSDRVTQPEAAPQPYVHQYPPADPKRVLTKTKQLQVIEAPLHQCQQCRLGAQRTNLVFGVGNPDTALMFIGEGPGREEDEQGIPFVGRAGQLLTDMIEKGMKIQRADVYIANVVKCRPPENRAPQEDEMETCVPYLDKQIEIIQPKVIVLLGATPLKGLIHEKLGITKIRGKWLQYKGIPVMPTFHPAYLLRNPPAKREVWEDLKQVIAFLNGEIEPPS